MKLINASDLKLYIMRHLLIDEDSTTEEIERQILRAIDVQPELAYCPNCGAKMDEEVSE